MKLVEALKPDGTFVYNADDTIVNREIPGVLQRTLGFSRYLESDYTGSHDHVVYRDERPIAYEFTVTHAGEAAVVRIEGTAGAQQVYACAAAIAVADVLGISLQTAASSLTELRSPNGRLRIIEGIKSTTILDDTYNASPTACEQALQTLSEIRYSKRKIAVLGDMLELGRFSSQEHKRIGELAAKSADMLLTIGVRALKIAEGALEMGMPEEHILQYDDSAQAGTELQAMLEAGDVILVKASQGIRAERVVEEVMAHPEQASELLVRQDGEWIKRK
jgi:UDP-N-acetylmuramoyl-tripeptide--D-alanyl-D-alanine ligase